MHQTTHGHGTRNRLRMVAPAGAVLAALLVGGLTPVSAAPAQARSRRPGVQKVKALTPRHVPVRPPGADPAAAAARVATPAATWPTERSASVSVPAGSSAGRGSTPSGSALFNPAPSGSALSPGDVRGWARAAGTPVSVARSSGDGPSSVRVFTLGRSATQAVGVTGVLLGLQQKPAGDAGTTVATTAGALDVRVDYGAFAGAVGGDWASRLRLVQLPACALTTPRLARCQTQTPLSSSNDARRRTVTATVTVPGARAATVAPEVVLAVLAAGSGPAGDFAATSLSSSSNWQVSQQTGAFSWSYPLRVPPTQGGPSPDLSISYSSQSVDGRTASTNNQPSWVGEGHDVAAGYVERGYTSCADDMTGGVNTVKTGDLCFSTDNATIMFDGKSSELVKASTGVWRVKDDDGARITRASAPWANGDDEKEYWLLTDTDGTKYYFGYGQRYTTDTLRTNSVWTAPVAFNQAADATGLGGTTPVCSRKATLVASFCTKAWRWNLDYVVDTQGNTMTYSYVAEKNRYGQNNNKTATGTIGNSVEYTRGGYLFRLNYGQRRGSEDTVIAPQRVAFSVAERCLPSGTITCTEAQFTTANASYWPDVPVDQVCASTTTCPSVLSPAFFSRKRLTKIQTQTYQAAAYSTVDAWTLGQSFPDPGDATSKALWLSSISHSGTVGTAVTLPDVTFTGVQRQNRVDGLDSDPPFIRWRVAGVATEAGARVSVNYSGADCTPTSLPSTDENNTRRCYPQYWTRQGATTQTKTYFHKYVVTSVVTADLTGGGADQVTSYDYLGPPAWHYDDLEIVPAKRRTYSDWRGYGRVRMRTGDPQTPNTATETAFLRGMDGDRLPGGTTRSVSVSDRLGTVTDSEALNGFVREEATYLGMSGSAPGEVLEQTFNDPWLSPATATGGGDTARIVRTDRSRTFTATPAAGAGTERITGTDTTYDDDGFPTVVADYANTGTTSDDRCTRISYARNVSANILATSSRSETVSVGCAATPSRPADVLRRVLWVDRVRRVAVTRKRPRPGW
jgi:hypothetical protein